MRIDWTPAEALAFACPVCRSDGVKRSVLAVESPFNTQDPLRLHACDVCGTLSFPGLTPPAYEDDGAAADAGADTSLSRAAIKFYVEQGAAPDTMVEPLFWFDHADIGRYAEVGCGFGFGLDFAREALGWEVRGFDPSPLARAGRRLLDLPVTSDYLGPETLRGEAPVDVLLASEVIEHVVDPHRFLDDITPTLSPDGWLVISTPNAAGVSREASWGALLPILTPGYHLVLFSEAALSLLLEAHGFTQVRIRASETNLTALACRRPRSCDLSRTLDRALYRDYLKRRVGALDPDEPLAHGFSGRLIKEWVNAGDIEAAQAEFHRLAGTYRRRYGIDLDRPETVLVEPIKAESFQRFAAATPANLCGLAYRSAFIALRHANDPERALAGFELGERAGVALREALQSIGSDDGETEHLVELCRLGVLESSIRVAPSEAPMRLKAAREAFVGTDGDGLRASRRFEIAVEHCFVDLVFGGAYAAANALAGARCARGWDAPEAFDRESDPATDLAPHERARSCHARGLLALNDRSDAAAALVWFRAAGEYLRVATVSDGAVEDLAGAIEMARFSAWAVAEPAGAALECAERLAATPSPSAQLFGLCCEVFQRLIHGGAYAEAATLEPAITDRLSLAPEMLSAELAFVLGILALNHAAGPVDAFGWFSQAAQLAPPEHPLKELALLHARRARAAAGIEDAGIGSESRTSE
ncbi:class I SAM-dependent methyltransferase [Thiocapsa bogorovii]|uniref:class I SAM-dependent methyltransferase n=1 Tax=Thiocapsa bogorovii TaxID=521689 RepID=UPI001E42DDFF|nr:class I SAM-dependent methyltransferase [Thiocapsa bogorovii]UHD14784.1 class I SAM-dependent methyltransferase [Thiocapsa bogorovii]